jgi:hypothetical protein
VAIKKQQALVSEGKITKEEVSSYMKLSTEIGQYSTTDLTKACGALTQFEKKLAIVK